MTDTDDSAARSSRGSQARRPWRVGGGHRWRNLAILAAALCIALYAAYAGRRTPVGPQLGAGISWPNDSQPAPKKGPQARGIAVGRGSPTRNDALGAPNPSRFRVATYNIHRGKGLDGIRDLKRTAQVLRDADLVGLNEVAGPPLWGRADQAEQLARNLKIGWLFAPNQYRWHRYHFGNGLLSRLEVGRWTSEPLAYDEATTNSPRNRLLAEIMAGAQPITVMVTHLDRGRIRPVQLQSVLSEFVAHTPAVLVGDLNTTAADPVFVAFFADSNNVDAIGRSLGTSDDKNRIDWIITRGMNVLSGGMEPAGVSDHPCYWVDVEPLPVAGP
jgi:endonuclease/exonuclease/phosphatase family metal-dependent hydrolase